MGWWQRVGIAGIVATFGVVSTAGLIAVARDRSNLTVMTAVNGIRVLYAPVGNITESQMSTAAQDLRAALLPLHLKSLAVTREANDVAIQVGTRKLGRSFVPTVVRASQSLPVPIRDVRTEYLSSITYSRSHGLPITGGVGAIGVPSGSATGVSTKALQVLAKRVRVDAASLGVSSVTVARLAETTTGQVSVEIVLYGGDIDPVKALLVSELAQSPTRAAPVSLFSVAIVR